MQKRKYNRQLVQQNYYDSSNYYGNNNEQENVSDLNVQVLKNYGSGTQEANKSTGYSTDVDTFARSKRLLALERSWINLIKNNELGHTKLK